MKRWMLLAALWAPLALGGNPKTVVEEQALSEDAPVAVDGAPGLNGEGKEHGLHLGDLRGFRVAICPGEGETLDGTGSIRFFLFDQALGEWMENPDLEIDLTGHTSATDQRCLVFADQLVVVGLGDRVKAVATGVGVSGGTTVAIRYRGETR